MGLHQHISIKRLFSYLKFDLALHAKKYLVFIVVLCFVLFLIDLYLISNTSHYTYNNVNLKVREFLLPTYKITFAFTLIASMVLVAGSSFPAFRQQRSSENYLLFPVSTLEKFIVQFVLRVLLFGSLFVILYVLDFKLATYVYNLFDLKNQVVVPSFGIYDFFPNDMSKIDKGVIVLSYLSIASFMFAGATYFKKHALLKSLLCLVVLSFLSYLFSVVLSHIFLPDEVQGLHVRVFDRKLDNNLNTIQLLFYVIGSLSSLFFIPLAYLKLKEKEV